MENPHVLFDDCPNFLKDYLFYLTTITGRSEKTTYEYYLDNRMFLRHVKCIRGLVPKETPMDSISIREIDADFLKSITLSDAYSFLHYLSKIRENDSKARARKVSAIRGFYRYLSAKTSIDIVNPMDALEVPSIRKSLPKHLSLEESLEVLAVIKGKNQERNYCIFTLFLNCGMRLSELVGLNLKALREDSLTVLGKGNKERMIYLNEACQSAIVDYLAVRPEDSPEQEALFISRNGKRISRRRVQQVVEETLKKAGLDNLGYSTHKLRHTAATLMFQYGNVDIRVLKDILGHENISTTEIYTHVSNKQLEKAVQSSPLSKIKKREEKD